MISLGLGLQNANKPSESGFSLTDIAGLQLWGKNQTGVTTGTTLTWADQSGNGHDLKQTVVNSQPTYSSSDGGFDFAGSSPGVPLYLDFHPSGNLSLGAFSAFFVIEMNQGKAFDFYGLTQSTSDPNNSYIMMYANSKPLCYNYVVGGPNANQKVNALQSTNSIPGNIKFIYGITKSASVNATTTFFNNENRMAFSNSYSSTTPIALDVLGFKVNGDRSFNGKIYEVAIYNTFIDEQAPGGVDNDFNTIINDLKERNGIA